MRPALMAAMRDETVFRFANGRFYMRLRAKLGNCRRKNTFQQEELGPKRKGQDQEPEDHIDRQQRQPDPAALRQMAEWVNHK